MFARQVAKTSHEKAIGYLQQALKEKFPGLPEFVVRATLLGTTGTSVPTSVIDVPNLQYLNRNYLAAAIYLINSSVMSGTHIPEPLVNKNSIIKFFHNAEVSDPILRPILRQIGTAGNVGYYNTQKATLASYLFIVLPQERDMAAPIAAMPESTILVPAEPAPLAV